MLLYGVAHLAHAHVSVSHHGEGVELPAAQVQEGAAALGGVTAGVGARGRHCLDGVVLRCATVAPAHRHGVAAAVLLH